MTTATITVSAFNKNTDEPITDYNNDLVVERIECSTDIPADVLGEVTAMCMSRAWRTGVDGTEIKLVVEFS